MSTSDLFDNLLGNLFGGGPGDEYRPKAARRDFRRAGQRRRRATLQHRPVKRARPAPHEVFPASAMRPRGHAVQAAREARLDLVYNAQAQENATLPDHEQIPWVFPWQEQAARDARNARQRQRQARRVTRRRG